MDFAGTAGSLAYIDAGTGSIALQFLVGSLLGVLFIGKVFWRSVVGGLARLLGRKRSRHADDMDSDDGAGG